MESCTCRRGPPDPERVGGQSVLVCCENSDSQGFVSWFLTANHMHDIEATEPKSATLLRPSHSSRVFLTAVPGDGLLLRRRLAHAAVQVRGPFAGGHGALLHRRDGARHRLAAPAALRAPRHQTGQRAARPPGPHRPRRLRLLSPSHGRRHGQYKLSCSERPSHLFVSATSVLSLCSGSPRWTTELVRKVMEKVNFCRRCLQEIRNFL